MSSLNKEDVLRKVRALIERAEHANTPEPEAESCRIKADQLMLVYAIESFDLEGADQDEKNRPELREFWYGETGDRQADDELCMMYHAMAKHCGAKIGHFGWRMSKVVGYASDLDYLDLMFTSVRMDLSSKVGLKADPSISLEDNVAAFKSAGWAWKPIYDELMKAGILPYYDNGHSYVPKKDGGLTFRAYKRWLKAHPGEEHIGENPKRYKLGFIKGYSETVQVRIMRMTKERQNTVEEKGYGIVLYARGEELDEFLWEQFPDQRPHDPHCQCLKCNPPTEKSRRRISTYRQPAYSANAYRKGASEGDKVNLNIGRNGLADNRREIV